MVNVEDELYELRERAKMKNALSYAESRIAALEQERDKLKERINWMISEVHDREAAYEDRIAKMGAVLSRFKRVKQINGGAFLYEMFDAEELAALDAQKEEAL